MRTKPSYVEALQRPLAPAERLRQIVNHGMCIGCGACQSIAGTDSVQMQLGSDGSPEPVVVGTLSAETMDKIAAICPGTRVEGLPEWLVEEDSDYDEAWGIWRQIMMAWAGEDEIRHLASTGGVLTALALFLIETGQVDFVLHARASSTQPAFGERFVSRSREDVLEAAGSRYGPTPTLLDIIDVLDQCDQADERFAFIGTPCDVSALRNLANLDPRVDRFCAFQLTMVCGGFMAPADLGRFLGAMDIEMQSVSHLRYRGYGCPGPTRIETTDGSVHEIDYLDFWGEDESGWKLPHRCKVCPDGIGDAADLAAADAWPGGAPDRQLQKSDPGSNAVIVRSQRAERLVKEAVASGYLVIGDTLSPRQMDEFQPHQVRKKRAVWGRFVGMRSAGSVVPDVRGLRLKPMARRNSLRENLAQARGGRRRFLERSGKT